MRSAAFLWVGLMIDFRSALDAQEGQFDQGFVPDDARLWDLAEVAAAGL